MELTAAERDPFGEYLGSFDSLSGDRRTRAVFAATVRGIIGSESLCCSRIAAFSPVAAEGASGGCGERMGGVVAGSAGHPGQEQCRGTRRSGDRRPP